MHTTLLCMCMHVHCTCTPFPHACCPFMHAPTNVQGLRPSILKNGKVAHPQQVQPSLADRIPTLTCSLCPLLHPLHPPDCLCPCPHRGLHHLCPPHLCSHPMHLQCNTGWERGGQRCVRSESLMMCGQMVW